MNGAHRMFGISSKWWAGVLLICGEKREDVDVAKSLTHAGQPSTMGNYSDRANMLTLRSLSCSY